MGYLYSRFQPSLDLVHTLRWLDPCKSSCLWEKCSLLVTMPIVENVKRNKGTEFLLAHHFHWIFSYKACRPRIVPLSSANHFFILFILFRFPYPITWTRNFWPKPSFGTNNSYSFTISSPGWPTQTDCCMRKVTRRAQWKNNYQELVKLCTYIRRSGANTFQSISN